MRIRAAFENANPLASWFGIAVAGVLLVITIFLTVFDLPWIAFLSGVLSAAAIGLVGRLAYTETELAQVRETMRYIEDDLAAMIAYVSADGRVRFHNQSFRYWLRARREAINGRQLRDIVGLTVFGQLRAGLESALAGHLRQETRIHESPSSEMVLHTLYLPHADTSGAVIGAFIVQADVTSLEDTVMPGSAALGPSAAPAGSPALAAPAGSPPPAALAVAPPAAPASAGEPERSIFVSTMTEELTGWRNAGERLRAALDGDEFCLGCQAIVPVAPQSPAQPCHEMLLRLREEEESLMPPGAFLPIAEEFGMLPDLDRWVVGATLRWIAARPARRQALYCINVAAPTIANVGFPEHVAAELERHGLPGSLLCFEVLEADVLARRRDAARFVAALKEAGCRTTLCGFGRNAESYALLRNLPVDFLKIDGDIILGLTRNNVDLIKLKAITRVARATQRRTIAEFVEDEATIALLREHGVDYAQGFGVARPVPLEDLP